MKHFAATLSLLALLASGIAYAESPQTLRLDFFHTGNHEMEVFSVDEIVIEPLPWPGNLQWPIDSTSRGKYLFEVVDPESQDILYSRSFSSIYGEWETTAEATKMNRTFHESLRFPKPDSVVTVVLKKRGPGNVFEEIWRIPVDPDDYMNHKESAQYAEQLVAVHESGDPAEKVDLLLLGDGYTAEEQKAFIEKARELTELLLATSPFKERADDINVWALAPAAMESGVSRPLSDTHRDSPLRSTYDSFRSKRYVLTFDNKSMRRIASSAPYDFIEILTNSETYGGGGIYGLFSTAAANGEWAPYLFVHEFGHHFAGLADEYYTSPVAYTTPDEVIEPYEPNVTALLDPENLKWGHLVAESTPIPTPWPKQQYDEFSIEAQKVREEMRNNNAPEADMNKLFRDGLAFNDTIFSKAPHRDAIGAFQGANYDAQAYYRSEQNCIMFTRIEHFCSVCSIAIDQVIDEYSRPQE